MTPPRWVMKLTNFLKDLMCQINSREYIIESTKVRECEDCRFYLIAADWREIKPGRIGGLCICGHITYLSIDYTRPGPGRNFPRRYILDNSIWDSYTKIVPAEQVDYEYWPEDLCPGYFWGTDPELLDCRRADNN